LLTYAASRIIGYAIAKAQKRGDLPASNDWWRWSFSYPAKLTIDDGRITKELETLWRIGAVNMRDIVGMRGGDLEPHLRERATDIALCKTIAKEVGEAYGVEIEDREMSMLTPNEPANSENSNEASKTNGGNTNEDN
jgi:hypothetical protein